MSGEGTNTHQLTSVPGCKNLGRPNVLTRMVRMYGSRLLAFMVAALAYCERIETRTAVMMIRHSDQIRDRGTVGSRV